ncbi:MAG: hypothetical protein ACK4VW_08640 [Anaerolineales bacterium]
MKCRFLLFLLLASALFGCSVINAEVERRVAATVQALSVAWTQRASVTPPIPSLTWTAAPSSTPTPQPSPTPSPLVYQTKTTLSPNAWKSFPVIPTAISERVRQIYRLGQLAGNNPRAFSKVGDCHSNLPTFFGPFDSGEYNLGEYAYLQETIDYFKGSWGRRSRAVKDGLTASAALAVLWNDWKDCSRMETPLDCEYRIHKPAFALISFGTNDVMGVAPFEITLRWVIDVTIGHNIVPILVTKADNAEGDHRANQIIAQLAYEYDLPLWNFWAAVQLLPDHGLMSRDHLSYSEIISSADFSPAGLKYGYNVRNLTGLQVLDAIRRMISEP